jgi:hypothetical protein
MTFDEVRRLLLEIGYQEKTTDNAHVFHRNKKDLVVFRLYRPTETLDVGDVLSTRKFLDMRGILDAADFDAFLETMSKPA